ncbi:MAG: aromatic ring-opening dioxygenase subunit LigB, partial [Chloroflexota bacterium]|nr:aromatic ring-opening dioxygenase subunit LigB [Chloroflexota bacterium]
LGRRFRAAGVEVIVVAGPHGARVDGAIALADVGRGAGILHWEGRTVEMSVPIDTGLTDGIAQSLRANQIPVAMVGFAGNRRDQSVIPLDWGTMTPLWFFGHDRNLVGLGDVLATPPEDDTGPPAVVITPSRSLPREALLATGRAVAAALAADPRRIAFVSSCDWGHRHTEDGPYGYHPASAEVDAEVVAAIKADDLTRLLAISDERAAEAAIDGLWQTLVLAGVLENSSFRPELLVYEAPRYYGMIVAAYEAGGATGG